MQEKMEWMFRYCIQPIQETIDEMADVLSEDLSHLYLDEIPTRIRTEDEKIMVRLSDMNFSISYSDDVFEDCQPNKKVLDTWFENGNPKESLYQAISKLSYERRKPHNPEWFKKHLSTVRFHIVNKQMVPYRYSVCKSF